MDKDKANALFMLHMDNIPEASRGIFNNALVEADESCETAVMVAPVKKPITTLLLSIFLGTLGIDRFYIGDKMLGIIKLALFILPMVFTIIGTLSASVGLLMTAMIMYTILGIWALVDIFVCYKRTRTKNLDVLLKAAKG